MHVYTRYDSENILTYAYLLINIMLILFFIDHSAFLQWPQALTPFITPVNAVNENNFTLLLVLDNSVWPWAMAMRGASTYNISLSSGDR